MDRNVFVAFRRYREREFVKGDDGVTFYQIYHNTPPDFGKRGC
jgi:hypothetical protein